MKKIAIVIITSLIIGAIGISGCTSKAPQPVDYTNLTQNTSTVTQTATVTATTTPTATPTITPPPTPTDVYQVTVSGPTTTQSGIMWTATVYKNGVVVPCDQLMGQVSWYINGQPSSVGCTMTHDANGLAGSPFQHTNSITATYQGVTSSPVLFTDNEIAQPTPTPTLVNPDINHDTRQWVSPSPTPYPPAPEPKK